ncbi:MAG TPA: hypothetical protein VFP34_03985 [Microlunatus sp.]|nr:hypothetical protein [Microlunatus sp.]
MSTLPWGTLDTWLRSDLDERSLRLQRRAEAGALRAARRTQSAPIVRAARPISQPTTRAAMLRTDCTEAA